MIWLYEKPAPHSEQRSSARPRRWYCASGRVGIRRFSFLQSPKALCPWDSFFCMFFHSFFSIPFHSFISFSFPDGDGENRPYKRGAFTKGNINKKGYNKFLSMDGEVEVAIYYHSISQPVACGTGFSYSQIKDRDTSYVSFYTQTHQGSYMHRFVALKV